MPEDRYVRQRDMARGITIAIAMLLACSADDDDDGGGDAPTGSASSPTSTATDATAFGDDDDGDDPPATDATTPTTDDPDTTAGPDTGDDATTAGGDPGRYLLTVDTDASPPTLIRIDLDDMGARPVCTFPSNVVYDSIVFARDGRLFGHNQAQSRLDTVNPCNCGLQLVGSTSAGPLVLTLDAADDDLLALEPGLDAFLRVNAATGLANVIGSLGRDFVGTGAAWSDDRPGVYAIDDATDELFTIDQRTGAATLVVALSEDLTTPGLAAHPDGDHWVCSSTSLFTLDPTTGTLTLAGDLPTACRTLAAPTTAVPCLD